MTPDCEGGEKEVTEPLQTTTVARGGETIEIEKRVILPEMGEVSNETVSLPKIFLLGGFR